MHRLQFFGSECSYFCNVLVDQLFSFVVHGNVAMNRSLKVDSTSPTGGDDADHVELTTFPAVEAGDIAPATDLIVEENTDLDDITAELAANDGNAGHATTTAVADSGDLAEMQADSLHDPVTAKSAKFDLGTSFTSTQAAEEDDDAKAGGPTDVSPPDAFEESIAVQDMMEEGMDLFDEMEDQKYSRLECLCFFVFLGLFTAIAILRVGTEAYPQTLTIRQSLIDTDEFTSWNGNGQKSFEDISTIEDIYNYLETVAIPFLLNPDNDFYVQSQQRLLGGIRLKQVL